MSKADLFCEMAFWEHLIRVLKNDYSFDLFNPNDKVENARKVWSMIRSSKCIHFDDEDLFVQAIQDEDDDTLRKLWKLSDSEGFPEVTFEKDKYIAIEDIDERKIGQSPIYLIADDEAKNNRCISCGVLSLSINFCLSNKHYYRDFGQSIRKGRFMEWENILGSARHSCNSMLIFDNYVLKKREENLYRILDVLLPEKMDFPFHLSIFTLEDSPDINEKQKEIADRINEIRKELQVELTIYLCGKNDFHDRAIITNYIWIGCGGGFDLLNSKLQSSKMTNIPIFYPYIQDGIDWGIDHYQNFINDAKRVKKHNRSIGKGSNRLLNNY